MVSATRTARTWVVEWRKLVSTPALVLGYAIGIAAAPLTTLIVLNHGASSGQTTVMHLAMSTAAIPVLVFALCGAYATTVEYESGAIVSSLLVVPHRAAFYTAKVGAVALLAAVAAAISWAATIAVVLLATPEPGPAVGPLWALPVGALVVGGVAAVGAAAGFVLRGALTTAVALVVALLGAPALGPALGGARRWVIGSGPAGVIAQAVGADQSTVGWSVGAAVFSVTVAVVVLIGWRAFATADH